MSIKLQTLKIPRVGDFSTDIGHEAGVVMANTKTRVVKITPYRYITNPTIKAKVKSKFINLCTLEDTTKKYFLRRCVLLIDPFHIQDVERDKMIIKYAEKKLGLSYQYADPTWLFHGMYYFSKQVSVRKDLPGGDQLIPRMAYMIDPKLYEAAKDVSAMKFYGGRIKQITNNGRRFKVQPRILMVDAETYKGYDFKNRPGRVIISETYRKKCGLTWAGKLSLYAKGIWITVADDKLFVDHTGAPVDMIMDAAEHDKFGVGKDVIERGLRYRPGCAPETMMGKSDPKKGWDNVAYHNMHVSWDNSRNNTDYDKMLRLKAMLATGLLDNLDDCLDFLGFTNKDGTKTLSLKLMMAHLLGLKGIPTLMHPDVKPLALKAIWTNLERLLLKRASGYYLTMVDYDELDPEWDDVEECEELIQIYPHGEVIKAKIRYSLEKAVAGVPHDIVLAIHKDYDGDAVSIYVDADGYHIVSKPEELDFDLGKKSNPPTGMSRKAGYFNVLANMYGTGGGHLMRMAAIAASHKMPNVSDEDRKRLIRWVRAQLEQGVNSKTLKEGEISSWKDVIAMMHLNKKIANREREASTALRGGNIIKILCATMKLKPRIDGGPFERALTNFLGWKLAYRHGKSWFQKRLPAYIDKINDQYEHVRSKSAYEMFSNKKMAWTALDNFMRQLGLKAAPYRPKYVSDDDFAYRWKITKQLLGAEEGMLVNDWANFMLQLYYKKDYGFFMYLFELYIEWRTKDDKTDNVDDVAIDDVTTVVYAVSGYSHIQYC